MYPVLLRWHGVRVHSYAACLYVGMVLGMIAGNYAANVSGLHSARAFVAMVLLIVAGLVGARLLFIATHWSLYRSQPSRIWRRSEGGAAVQGGLLLAVAVSVPLLAAIGLPFGAFWDVMTLAMLIGLIFARLGCLLHGCCGGRPTRGRFALYLPDHRGVWRRRIPTQLLEAGGGVLILLGAVGLWDQRPFHGAIFLAAVTAYAWGRSSQCGRLGTRSAGSTCSKPWPRLSVRLRWLACSPLGLAFGQCLERMVRDDRLVHAVHSAGRIAHHAPICVCGLHIRLDR
jgi:phosphatidylglycerol---prolipoprotein diacylglyceryl transferase